MTDEADEVIIGLVEPARQQLIALAADVLGRLPPEQVPVPLRVIARFAPAKRQRLGAVALAATLDCDDDFRAKVAEAVVTSSPDLVAAVAAGGSTAAADPVDVVLVAYLTRPDGWQARLEQATRRWSAERVAGPADEVARLRSEVSALRAQVRGESTRTREAVARAGEQATTELDQLRQQQRRRTGELRSAERARDEAIAAGGEAQAAAARQAGTSDGEVRRLQRRVTELERAVEAARRTGRTERDVDDARLWLLIDTLVQAASGLRRELSLAAPDTRPADALVAAGVDPARRAADDPAALDRLLALPDVHLVVDGYNVTKTGYGELSLSAQRERLVGSLAPLAAQSGAEITIAFDGGVRPPSQPPVPRGVRVLFSAADEIADDLIRRIVAAEPPGRVVIVVTSDRQVVTDTARDGAWSAPSAVLLARLG